MPFNDTALNRMADAEAAAATWISANTAGDVQHGTRAQTTWGPATAGDRVGSQVAITIATGITVTSWSLWTAATGGTCEGTWALGASEAFPNGGTFQLTPTLAVDPGN